MQPVPDEWSDPNFIAPSTTTANSVDELVSNIRTEMARGAMPIEDLRLYILTRLYQEHDPSDIANELVAWGLRPDYASELVTSAQATGNFGVVEVRTELVVNGSVAGSWQNPTYEVKRQIAARVARVHREARRLAGVSETGADLGFEPNQLHLPSTSAAGNSDRKRYIMAFLLALGLVGGFLFLASR